MCSETQDKRCTHTHPHTHTHKPVCELADVTVVWNPGVNTDGEVAAKRLDIII
jgi:hypothetical protein